MNNWLRNPLGLFVFIIVVAAMIAVVYVMLGVFGIAVPAWVVHIFWICFCAFIGVAALTFLASLLGGWWKNPPPGP